MANGNAHDWDLVKQQYVEGIMDGEGNILFPTLQTLSDMHNIPESTIRKRSAADDWATERNIFRQTLERKRREAKTDVLAGKSAEFDAQVFRLAEIGINHLKIHFINANNRLAKSEAAAKAEGEENPELFPMALSAMENLSRSLERLQRIGRLALGEATDLPGGDQYDDEERQFVRELIRDPNIAERVKEYYRAQFSQRPGAD